MSKQWEMILQNSHNNDVAVIGAGMGGLASSIFLAKAGLRVVCIEPEPFPRSRVGESLDWSAPSLLHELGVEPELLIESQYATQKSKIRVVLDNGFTFIRTPDYPLIRQLSGVKGDTLHVNRVELDQLLFKAAKTLGVSFIWEGLSRIEAENDRVVSCHTATGQCIVAPWFIDASGRARLFAQYFEIPKTEYGHRKVCFWTNLETNHDFDGTTFYICQEDKYLAWIWEIPITSNCTSLGYITHSDEIRKRRRIGQTIEQILISELAKFPRFSTLVSKDKGLKVETTTFQGFVGSRSSGENWLLVGEAAAMADPLTGNGVTAALRNAKEASGLITDSMGRTTFSEHQRQHYDTNVRSIVDILNYGIEAAVYEGSLRRGLGASTAVSVYVLFGFLTNAFYPQYGSEKQAKRLLTQIWLLFMKVWIRGWAWMGRLTCWIRQGYPF